MEIRYDNTEDDILAFNIYHSMSSRVLRRKMQFSRFLLPTVLVVAVLVTIGWSAAIGGMVLISPLVIAWIAFYPKYWRHELKRNIRKMFREGKNLGVLGEHYMKIDQHGLIERTSVGESSSTWSGVERIARNNDYIFIYSSALGAYIVPRRAFASQTEFDKLHDLAESYRSASEHAGTRQATGEPAS